MLKPLIALVLSLCLGAAERVPTITQAKVDGIAKHWQNVLQLNDWRIEVNIAKLSDLPNGAAAFSVPDRDAHYLAMFVLPPSEYPALARMSGAPELHGKAILADIEISILHELVHLRLMEFSGSDAAHLHSAEEYTVVRLTSALLSARGKR